jgi:hypothetical protein
MEASQGFDAQKLDLLETVFCRLSLRACHSLHLTRYHDSHPLVN